jgi:tRNA wybutosine-synthesizing protein 1
LQVLYESSSDDADDGDETEVKGQGLSDGLVDLEDIGGMMGKMKSAKQRRLEEEEAVKKGEMEAREMVTPMLRKSLSKQGVASSHVTKDLT